MSTLDDEAPEVELLPTQLLNPGGSTKRKVLVLYTGGTMGMMNVGGGALGPVQGALVKRLQLLEELDSRNMPQCFLVEFRPVVDSADMCPQDWATIATAISDNYYEYDGFVVIHGTDTMAYTASALSFMLEQLAKPVVLTGSQLPFFEPLSDARQNFLGAIVFAGLADISEVCIFFQGKLMRGCRTTKQNAIALEAFSSPSYPYLAELGAEISIYRRRLREPPRGRFRLHKITETEIVVLWLTPGFSDDFLEGFMLSKSLKGMVLLLYGCGNAPARKKTFVRRLKQLADNGVVLVACSQCLQGSVALEKYKVGKALQDCGVLSASDMTTEAAVTKLSYLLSKDLEVEEVKEAFGKDLRGEMLNEDVSFRVREPVTGLVSSL